MREEEYIKSLWKEKMKDHDLKKRNMKTDMESIQAEEKNTFLKTRSVIAPLGASNEHEIIKLPKGVPLCSLVAVHDESQRTTKILFIANQIEGTGKLPQMFEVYKGSLSSTVEWSGIKQMVAIPSTGLVKKHCALVNIVDNSGVGHIYCLTVDLSGFELGDKRRSRITVNLQRVIDVQTENMSEGSSC